MAEEYVTPEFLSDSDEDVIHQRMLDVIPDDIDKSEAGFLWDATRPTAIEHSRLKGFNMNEAIKLIWPQFASDIYLDYHGKTRKMARKEGVKASGMLTIEVKANTSISEGALFSTESVNGVSNVTYQTLQAYSFVDAGTYEIEVECTEVGEQGNVAPGTIVLKGTPNDNITSITNLEKFNNGIDQEDDDSYRERLVAFDQSTSASYIGNVNDYTRWASEVNGVGSVKVIPAQDESGTVTIVITDGNGDPASEELQEKVYNHIMSPDNEQDRLAPINAILNVTAPDTIEIKVSGIVEITGSDITTIAAEFLKAMQDYCTSAISDGEIRYTYVCSLLSKIPGVYDYKDVYINEGQSNIPIDANVMPTITESGVTLTVGTVV